MQNVRNLRGTATGRLSDGFSPLGFHDYYCLFLKSAMWSTLVNILKERALGSLGVVMDVVDASQGVHRAVVSEPAQSNPRVHTRGAHSVSAS